MRKSDEVFMDIIREYPTIYNRSSKDFKDKTKKSNCWRAVAERLDEPVDIVKRRYESIRTQFSKDIRARKGTSGCRSDDIPLTAKFEHLRWLKTFIITRTSTINLLKGKYPNNQPSQDSNQNQFVDSLSEEICDEDGHDTIADWFEYEEMSQGQGANTCVQASTAVSDNEAESTPESTQSLSTGTQKVATTAPSKKVWAKKESRKRQLEGTNEELSHAMQNVNKSLMRSTQQQSNKLGTELDEDHYYGMSIASRLRSLDRMKKAVLRNAIEKLFLDIEYGFYNSIPLSSYQQQTT